MRSTLTIFAIFFTSFFFAQDQYTNGMKKAFELWSANKPLEAANMFERISAVAVDDWLPYYYVAQINTIVSFGEKDEQKLTQQLEKAQEFVDLAKAISPNNAEILVQQAMIYTAWIVFDGATYGMTLSGKAAMCYEKAMAIAPNNPRVVFSKAEWEIGSARYFGKDIAPYCEQVAHSLELFANFKPASAFHPNWGKDRAEMLLENCNK